MAEFGVRCTMGDGEDTIITVAANDEAGALAEVRSHVAVFGGGDTAGRWLASKRAPANTVVTIHEAKPLADWQPA